MISDIYIQIIWIFILLAFSAFFSGSETAYFSLNYLVQEKLKNEKDLKSSLVYNLLKSPNRLLITILIGNMIVNILATAILSGLVIQLSHHFGYKDSLAVGLEIVLMTFILLIFGEITPKLITVKKPLMFARAFSFLIYILVFILRPISFIFQWFTDIITKHIGREDNKLDNSTIEEMIKMGHKEGIINKEERKIFENVMDSIDKKVQDIMIPISKMFLLDIHQPKKRLTDKIINSDFKTVPVYKKSRENILGIIRKQDLLPYYFNRNWPQSFRKLIRPIIYAPPGKKMNDLLKEFQFQKREFCIVADEFGNMIGYVTANDLIDNIIGVYHEECDRECVLKRKIGKNKF